MIVDFVSEYAKLVVTKPNDIKVNLEMLNDKFAQITISANCTDLGKLIGKNGNMVNAIKTMVNGCQAKDGIAYKIQVASI